MAQKRSTNKAAIRSSAAASQVINAEGTDSAAPKRTRNRVKPEPKPLRPEVVAQLRRHHEERVFEADRAGKPRPAESLKFLESNPLPTSGFELNKNEKAGVAAPKNPAAPSPRAKDVEIAIGAQDAQKLREKDSATAYPGTERKNPIADNPNASRNLSAEQRKQVFKEKVFEVLRSGTPDPGSKPVRSRKPKLMPTSADAKPAYGNPHKKADPNRNK